MQGSSFLPPLYANRHSSQPLCISGSPFSSYNGSAFPCKQPTAQRVASLELPFGNDKIQMSLDNFSPWAHIPPVSPIPPFIEVTLPEVSEIDSGMAHSPVSEMGPSPIPGGTPNAAMTDEQEELFKMADEDS